jgi:translation elongation factor EF-1alpha
VTGKIESGMIAPKDTLLLVPGNEACTVKAVQHRHQVVKFAAAGDNVELGLTGIDIANLG